ncbi:MAG: hypothetical protein AB7T22_08870 [Calditrichaceae bacterium]
MKELMINMDELAFVLHRGHDIEMECYLDTRSGDIISIPTNDSIISSTLDLEDDVSVLNKNGLVEMMLPDRGDLLYIPNNFSQILFELMSDFTKLIENDHAELHDMLWAAIQKGGGFEEFHRIIKSRPGILNQFIVFRDNKFEENAVIWLKDHEIKSV